MSVWGLIVLYVLAFSLLQLLLYRYLRSDDDRALFRSTPPSSDLSAMDDLNDFELEDRSASTNPETIVCPRCDEENETGYTYCWNCAEAMTAR
ncbi:DUF7577 domain-containing protein [Halorussus halophilus]|uniref:DUF7577 domain-containing protein n=1 Tax=Halorussus halophilus TaxID=2650975 RepID=UPI0013010AEF|nr:zinc ribbon domain-containing protein [Halorussus halophilus]